MKMPGMSGRDLATAFRTNAGSASLPLLLLSSREDRSSPLEGDDVFSAVLTKPVRGTRLLEVLREVLLPDLPSTRATRKSAADKIGSPTAPLRVLLAEDNGVNQLLGRLLLEKLGHHVDVVGDGQEAADAVRRLPYDVVLMDLQMPGMDGLEATRLIRSDIPAERQPKIVALTASVFIEDRAACDHAGMDDYLAKPVHITDLGAALARVSRRIDAPRPT
jgi:CheY-like chemotaxis protein